MRQTNAALLVLGFFLSCIAPAWADDPDYLWIGAGSWETLRSNYRKPEIDLAYHSDAQFLIFKPHIGLLAAQDGDYFGYVGVLTDIDLTDQLVATLTAAIGGYGGHGFNLGSQFEFRTGGELAWRFADQSRLGLGFYHLSNAGINSHNGGSESLLLSYSLPLNKLF
ncbi:MAG TPA: acyloxyacyl hydrolase [Rhodospirillaceae bacterium]|nr:acyloxyacyl hydrolase [Rhodospirillaceae bacterium]